jgi:hypothetical protein
MKFPRLILLICRVSILALTKSVLRILQAENLGAHARGMGAVFLMKLCANAGVLVGVFLAIDLIARPPCPTRWPGIGKRGDPDRNVVATGGFLCGFAASRDTVPRLFPFGRDA